MRSCRRPVHITLGITLFIGLGFLLALAVKLLWNALMPDIFGLPAVTYWQSLGLIALSHILFHSHGDHLRSHWRDFQWREHFADRISEMTPEQREQFRREWEDRCSLLVRKKAD